MKAVLQSEAAECGLACIAAVASAHGLDLSLPELRRRCSTSLKGARLSQLMTVAHGLAFRTRALRLEMSDLGALKTPCILHWDFNHFVVLERVAKNGIVVMDPAIGRRTLSENEVSKHFTGVALELAPTAEFEGTKAGRTKRLPKIIGSITGLRRSVLQIIAISMALQLFATISPFFMQWVVDQVIVSADRNLLTLLGVAFSLVLLLQVAIGFLRGWLIVFLSSQLSEQWTYNVVAHLLRLPLGFFEKRHVGDVASRLDSIQAIQRTLATGFVEVLVDGVMVAVTLCLMAAYSLKLALVTGLAVLAYVCVRAALYRSVRDAAEQQLAAAAMKDSHLLESLRGMQSIKVGVREAVRESAFANLLSCTTSKEARLARFGVSFQAINQAVFGAERIAVIWMGAVLVLSGGFSVGMLVAYLAYKDQFASRAAALVDRWIDFRMLRLHAERLADITESATEALDRVERISLDAPPSIEFRNVSFRYGDGDPFIIHECSFLISSGESVAIAGPSGCGKTTLVKLLLGLLQPTSGEILYSGVLASKLGPHAIRQMAGVVMQDDQLFAGTIAENIAFFDPDYAIEKVQAAAELASIHDEIAALPMGYYTLVGDMGSVLSGGQRQRIVLARALFKSPSLLVLDEATSNLDVVREQAVNARVKELALTRVIVAHRPETVASADRVIVLEGGRVAGSFSYVNPVQGARENTVEIAA